MKVSKSIFGKAGEREISLFTLENDRGMTVSVMEYGATITSIRVPDDRGAFLSVACGFDSLEDYFSEEYRNNAPYFGSTVGRYCSQIKDARFSLDGKEYSLADNCGANNLHGGSVGFDKKVWDAEAFSSEAEAGLWLSLVSPHMEEGFPGEVSARVRMSLNNENEIRILYEALCDKDTPLSMTNHSYFNLSGFAGDVEDHEVKVLSAKRLALDDTGAATGVVLDLEGKSDDLREGKLVGEAHREMGDGFEHFFVFPGPIEVPEKVAEVSHPGTGLMLEVESTEPCMLLYTGKYTSDALQRHDGERYGKHRAFCCETHRWPNGPNIPDSSGSITRAGEPFRSTTVFRFAIS